MNLALISSLVAASAGFAVAWQLQAHQIVKMELEDANTRIEIQRNARQTLERHMQTVGKAQDDATSRGVVLLAAAVRAADAGSGLRIASADTVRTASADTATCLASVAKYDQLITEMVAAGGIRRNNASSGLAALASLLA
jgi:hypothetical protein